MGRLQPGVLLAVAVGGAAGGPARAAIGLGLPTKPGHFPLAILIINVAGAFLIGALLALTPLLEPGGARLRALAATGFCGGFTTWSTFMVGAVQLVARARVGLALGYLAVSLAAGLLAAAVGAGLTERLTAGRRLFR